MRGKLGRAWSEYQCALFLFRRVFFGGERPSRPECQSSEVFRTPPKTYTQRSMSGGGETMDNNQYQRQMSQIVVDRPPPLPLSLSLPCSLSRSPWIIPVIWNTGSSTAAASTLPVTPATPLYINPPVLPALIYFFLYLFYWSHVCRYWTEDGNRNEPMMGRKVVHLLGGMEPGLWRMGGATQNWNWNWNLHASSKSNDCV